MMRSREYYNIVLRHIFSHIFYFILGHSMQRKKRCGYNSNQYIPIHLHHVTYHTHLFILLSKYQAWFLDSQWRHDSLAPTANSAHAVRKVSSRGRKKFGAEKATNAG